MTEKDEVTFQWFDGEFYPPDDIQALVPGKFPEEFALSILVEPFFHGFSSRSRFWR